MTEPGVPVQETSAGRSRARLTPRQTRNRIILLSVLLVLLALLSYATYYFVHNLRLPSLRVASVSTEDLIEPPSFLYSIIGQGANALDRPIGLGVAKNGRVYVVDLGHSRISVFTNAGRYLFSFNKVEGGTLRNPVHLVIKGDEVWVTDRRLRGVFVFALDGTFKRQFRPKGETDFAWTPLALAFDSAGALRVTDVARTDGHRLIYFSEDGSRTVTTGRTVQVTDPQASPGGFLFPNGLAVAKDGRVFVSDGDNRRVQVFTKDGKFDYFVDTSGIPRGIAIDSADRLYAVDAVAHSIDVYDLRGKKLTSFGSQGFGPGQFNYPNDVTTDGRGRIYITDRENNQVQVWGWPVAQTPALAVPKTGGGWALCLTPLLLLLLPLALRRIRIVVTPDFVDALIASGRIAEVARRRKVLLVCPESDAERYADVTVDGVELASVVRAEVHSESDARRIQARLECDEYQSVILSMSVRARALATEDREMRRLAVLIDARVMDVAEFLDRYIGVSGSPKVRG